MKALEEDLDPNFVLNFVQTTQSKNVPDYLNPRFMELVQRMQCVGRPLLDPFFNSINDIDSIDDMTVLQTAITLGQTYMVLQILEKGRLNIDSSSKINGLNALHCASKDGQLQIVKVLLNHGASINLPTSNDGTDERYFPLYRDCATPFHLAIAHGHLNVATFLEENGADVNKPCKSGLTPLHSAIEHSINMIKYLLQSSRYHHSFSTATLSGWTVLMDAAATSTSEVFRFILQGSNSSIALLQSKDGFNCLHAATKSPINPCQKVAMLKESCIDPCIPTAEGFLPLHFAAETSKQNLELEVQDENDNSALLVLCKMLLQKGTINLDPSWGSFFARAIRLLLRHGAIATQQDEQGNTALHYLCKIEPFTKLEYRCISCLLAVKNSKATNNTELDIPESSKYRSKYDSYDHQYGKNEYEYGDEDDSDCDENFMTTLDFPNQKVHAENDTSNSLILANNNNMTALHIMFNRLEILDDPELQPFGTKTVLLLISTASIDQLNNILIDGQRLLNVTLRLKQDQLSQALLDRGIDTISLDEGIPPRTALEMLCIYGSHDKKLIAKILSNHADKTALSARGYTLLRLACFNNQINVLEELLLAGWKTDILSRDEQPLILEGIQSGVTRIFIPGISMMGIDNYPALPSGAKQKFLAEIDDVTPLHIASFDGTKETVQYALDNDNNTDINLTASFGTTPLFFAIYGIQHDTIELLLSYGATTSELYGPHKLTPLHLGVVVGNELVVNSLLQHGADPQARDGAGFTPAMLALDLEYENIAKILAVTLAKLPPSAPVCSDSNTLTVATEPVGDDKYVSGAIEDAIIRQDFSTLKFLLQSRYELKGSCCCGFSPLLKAFITNSPEEIIHYLLDNGASLDGVVTCTKPIVTAGFTPLHHAAMLGDEQIMEKILKLGKPNTHQKVYPLHNAAYNGHFACVRLLLNHDLEGKCGVDVKTSLAQTRCLAEDQMVSKHIGVAKDICGTALHYSLWENHMNTMEELLRAGADLNSHDMKGKTPLHIAAENDQDQACQVLISTGPI
ncbi:hypothetical protein sscle_05g042630 [Sclerotinia sclerotiorum 1980 UF-70]|uniref:Uncharacterized protein n=1 Tax=Sclerotinia sclerotiorum (strain ATCC 18683 / 1980 / Ss-1) TaxID=665079 RepID=A0A1D9Q4J8_SCLS1|nr:hypothetical protein sscle_05g042630 [Sclerotinia sclerotiorum 1980 UF-70]